MRAAEGVVVIEMSRPERRNAMNTPMLEALLGVVHDVAADPSAAALVVTGAGGAFSSGADLSEEAGREPAIRRMALFGRLYELFASCPKPTVAAVAGACVGGGAEVAAACDLRVGTPSTAVRFPGAHFGAPVGAARLPLLVGLSHAKDLLLTARTVGADEAYRMGFLNRLVAEEALESEAVALAGQVAANRGAALQKRLLDEGTVLTDRTRRENRALLRWQRGARGLMG